MEEQKSGILGKIVSVVFLKVPWFIYLLILICFPLLGCLIDGFAPDIVNQFLYAFLTIPVAIILLWVMLGFMISITMKVSRADDLVDMIDETIYSRSYLLLLIICVVAMILGGITQNIAQGIHYVQYINEPFNASQYLASAYINEISVLFFLFGIVVLFTIPVKFLLRIFNWCPSCGKLFALKRTSSQVVGTEDINIKKTVDVKNTRGDVIGQTEQYISGTRKTTERTKTCKYCGHEVVVIKTRDYENV